MRALITGGAESTGSHLGPEASVACRTMRPLLEQTTE